jgi:hypothetical protein
MIVALEGGCMDEAWKLEQEFWREASAGTAGSFYQRHMITEGYVVIPSGVVSRDELASTWSQHRPIPTYELSDPRFALLDGPNVIISYHVDMDVDWLPQYSAWVTAVYTWEGNGWALATRAHTPAGPFSF